MMQRGKMKHLMMQIKMMENIQNDLNRRKIEQNNIKAKCGMYFHAKENDQNIKNVNRRKKYKMLKSETYDSEQKMGKYIK
jgi:hypothetical protein